MVRNRDQSSMPGARGIIEGYSQVQVLQSRDIASNVTVGALLDG